MVWWWGGGEVVIVGCGRDGRVRTACTDELVLRNLIVRLFAYKRQAWGWVRRRVCEVTVCVDGRREV